MKIAFYVNADKPRAQMLGDKLQQSALALGLEVVASSCKPDVLVVLGGDGTILAASHEFENVPLLGLNVGYLGYLAAVEEANFDEALLALKQGAFHISSRSMLAVDDKTALNDVVISKGNSGQAAVLELWLDGVLATHYFADGLIVATPTGSTAYSLSAGGPILLPSTEAFIITPMCPHSLTARPLVVPNTVKIAVRVQRRPGAEILSVFTDGVWLQDLHEGEELVMCLAKRRVSLVELDGYAPCEVLNRKLGWSGSSCQRIHNNGKQLREIEK